MKYWVIAPCDSKRADFDKAWNYDLQNHTIAIGWSAIGDPSVMTKDILKKRVDEFYPEKQKNYVVGVIWQLYHDISEGDVVIARKGLKTVLSIGKVNKTAYYDEKEGKKRVVLDHYYPNFIGVEWDGRSFSLKQHRFSQHTLQEISKEKYLAIVENANSAPNNVVMSNLVAKNDNSALRILDIKKQIILYGPPGTGKTYNTKEIAVALEGLPEICLMEYDNIKEKGNFDRSLYNKVEDGIKSLSGIEEEPRSSMVGYYSISKKTNRKIGLVWLGNPSDSKGSFRVHLRKEADLKYPPDIINTISDYKSNGWGGYPEFRVKDKNSADLAIELIKFAYERF